jgi:hypothetical protein
MATRASARATFTFTHKPDLPRRHRRHTVRRGPRVPRSFLTHHVVVNISTAIHKPPTPKPSKIANHNQQPRAQICRERAQAPSLVWGQVRCVYSEQAVTVPYILFRQLTLPDSCPIGKRKRRVEFTRPSRSLCNSTHANRCRAHEIICRFTKNRLFSDFACKDNARACGPPTACRVWPTRRVAVSARSSHTWALSGGLSGTPFDVAHVRGRASLTARFVRGTIHPARLLFYTF